MARHYEWRRKSLLPTREQDDVTPPLPPPPRHADTETNEHAFATGSCYMHGISRRPLTVQDSGGACQRFGLSSEVRGDCV